MLLTGSTHPRELISTQEVLFSLLALLHQGVVLNKESVVKILATAKIQFIPFINPDGAKYMEWKFNEKGVIGTKRKNMNPTTLKECGDEDGGTDLNRNWGVDWAGLSEYNLADKCGDYWPGS